MSNKKLSLVFMSGGIHIRDFDNRTRIILLDFCRKRIQWGTTFKRGRMIRKKERVFAASNQYRTEFFFHRHDWKELKEHLEENGILEQHMHVSKKGYRKAVDIEVQSPDYFQDREYQKDIISYALQPHIYSLTVPLQTGRGKTAVSLRIIEELGKRAGIVSRLKHVKQWIRDAKEQFSLTDKDIYLVQGRDKLIKLIKLAKEGKCDFKLIFFSNSTLQTYIKCCELGKWRDFGCKPQDLFQLLGIGIKVVDEAHESLHLNFKISMYIHVKKSVYLSASILTNDSFINKMSEIIFPPELRHDKLEWDKYIDVYAIAYRHERGDMRYQYPGNPNYAHSALEQWYLKHPKALANYFKMVGDFVYNHYVLEYKEGLKVSVFCSFVEFATELTKYLEQRFDGFSVGRYCATEDDPMEHLYDVDIRVTTPESAGTGTDIKDLYLNICLVNVASIQRNIQIQGRTRRVKTYPELTPKFIYVWATDIDKHKTGHENRLEIFANKAKNIFTVMSDYVI